MTHKIPQQVEGRKMDTSTFVSFDTLQEAQDFYQIARRRLLHISQWYNIAKIPMASFKHLNRFGQATLASPEVGDFIEIDIPGPGLSSTGGYDYVQIERIEETVSNAVATLTITLRPAPSPRLKSESETKHFFENLATSTLQIQQIANKVQAHYFGRNEVINLEVDSLADKIRNLFIGMGAKMGASFPQWKALLNGLVEKDTEAKNL